MFKWLFQKKSNKQESQLMSKKFLIVGLGNIGTEYVRTRHNIGFKVLNQLAKQNEIEFETRKLGALATYKLKGRTFLLLKPNTFMILFLSQKQSRESLNHLATHSLMSNNTQLIV